MARVVNKPQCACLFLILCLTPLTFAQAPAPPEGTAPQAEMPLALQPPELTPHLVSTPDPIWGLIQLDVVVTSGSGKPMTGLEAQDFTLLDNGQPSAILSFQSFDGVASKPDPPVEVILVLDAVNLSSEEAGVVQRQVDEFLRRNGGHLPLPVSVYRVSNSGLSVTSAPSDDGNVLAEEIGR